jgi:hypothetical protein
VRLFITLVIGSILFSVRLGELLPVMEEDFEMVEFSPKELSRRMMESAACNMMAW